MKFIFILILLFSIKLISSFSEIDNEYEFEELAEEAKAEANSVIKKV